MTIAKGPILGARHLQTLLLFLAIVVNYASRQNISVSLVAMTDAKTTNPNFHEFDWNEKEKSYILSSFFWGYTLCQLPGGYAARSFGVKTTLFIGTFMSSMLGLLVPFGVFWGGWQFFCVVRLFQGMSQAMLIPCVYQHLAKWAPVEERNRLGVLSLSGIDVGSIVAMYVTGIVAASDLGWPGVSYVFSGTGIMFCLIWFIYAENTPAEAKFIAAAERNYILTSQSNIEDNEKNKNIPIPWKAMLTSCPLLSVFVVLLCAEWGFATMQAQIPAYLHGALRMDISNNALFSALPYVTMWFFSFVYIIAADVALKNKWTTLLVVRKIINTVALWGPAAFLIGIGFLNENQRTLAIIFIILNVGLCGGKVIGSVMNLMDLSPNHAGIIMAFINTLASIIAVVCPIVVGFIVADNTDKSQWQTVFMIAAGIFFLGNLQYLFFAKIDQQPWNDKDLAVKDPNQLEMQK